MPSECNLGADRTGGLGHRLNNQNTRHDRLTGKMAVEMRFVEGDILDPNGTVITDDVFNPVNQQKRIAVRQQFENSVTSMRSIAFDITHYSARPFLTCR